MNLAILTLHSTLYFEIITIPSFGSNPPPKPPHTTTLVMVMVVIEAVMEEAIMC